MTVLFIIYINDLPEVCKQFVDVFFLFADDAKLYKHVITDDDHQLLQTKRFNCFSSMVRLVVVKVKHK